VYYIKSGRNVQNNNTKLIINNADSKRAPPYHVANLSHQYHKQVTRLPVTIITHTGYTLRKQRKIVTRIHGNMSWNSTARFLRSWRRSWYRQRVRPLNTTTTRSPNVTTKRPLHGTDSSRQYGYQS